MSKQPGLIFYTIRGSLVDGYGIRTTVFLKGCPLRCIWCCNPEGQANYPEIKFTASLCDNCDRCIEICPVKAIQPRCEGRNETVQIDRKLCTNCGRCAEICYRGAIDFFGKYIDVEEVFDSLKKDETFYRSSGGGITIGGGEPTFQPGFTHELLRKCRENYLHVAVDTCGYTVNNEGLKVLEEADLLLFDLKGMDPKEHLKNTHVSNELILNNLKKLDALGKSIIIRMPIVPGYNASGQNLKSAGEFLLGLKSVERVDILPYHEYGAVKYRQLGRKYKMKCKPYPQEYISEIRDTLERYGLKVQIGG